VSSETVCAVVVTFNRKQLLLECLDCLRGQVRPIDAVYIIDNASGDGTPQALLQAGYIQELPPQGISQPWEESFATANLAEARDTTVHYVRMHENTGGSGGFHEGIKRAYRKGYDWVWVMDDDGKPAPQCLARLLEVAKGGFNYVAPNLVDLDGVSHWAQRFSKSRTSVVNFPGGPFNAILLSRDLIRAVGYPMRNFFLWGDELEYTDRIVEAGFPVVTAEHAIHRHRRTSVDYRRCTRGFYIVRNRIYRYRLLKGVATSRKTMLLTIIYHNMRTFVHFARRLNMRQLAACSRGLVRGCIDPLREHQEQCCWWGAQD